MPTFTLVNPKLLAVGLADEAVKAKPGALVAYQGEVRLARPAGAAVADLKAAATRMIKNEEMPIVEARGSGTVYYAAGGRFLTIVPLAGATLYVESARLLAFSPALETATEFQGSQGLAGLVRGAATGQGLFVTTVSGRGEVVLATDGPVVALPVSDARPVFVDPNAYVGHTGEVATGFVADVGWKALIGQSSGESFQLKCTGAGTVYFQASER